jgi:uncharacterized protein (DUF342 family)
MELFDEGLLDALKGVVGGITGKEPSEFTFIPKQEWEALMQNNAQAVQLLANTPGIKDAAGVASDILNQLNSLAAKKIQQQIRLHGAKIRDPRTLPQDKDNALQEIKKIIVGLKNEADKIRTVRSGIRQRQESIEEIATIVTEDIFTNNGILIQ